MTGTSRPPRSQVGRMLKLLLLAVVVLVPILGVAGMYFAASGVRLEHREGSDAWVAPHPYDKPYLQ